MNKPTPDPKKVFVIHGRNNSARDQLFIFLRALGLSPIEWETAVHETGKGSPYIGEVLDTAFDTAQAVIVLETPDDIVYLRQEFAGADDPETQPQGQSRPNVLFEAGMAMGRNPDRTIIIEFGRIKQFSDIHGRHTIRLDNSAEKRNTLKNRLSNAGCDVDGGGTDWITSGDLTPPDAAGYGMPLGKRVPSPGTTSSHPRLTVELHARGGNKLHYLEITNHGPGDIYELDVLETDPDSRRLVRHGGVLPVPKLPAGKSFRLDYMGNLGMGDNSQYFNLRLQGKTAEGKPIDDEEFVSMP